MAGSAWFPKNPEEKRSGSNRFNLPTVVHSPHYALAHHLPRNCTTLRRFTFSHPSTVATAAFPQPNLSIAKSNQIQSMAKVGKKRSRSSLKKLGKEAAKSIGEVRHDLDWVRSTNTQKTLEGMVFEGVLQDQVTTGWCPTAGEPFPTPDTSELVVFVAYFVHGFGITAHPFL